LNAVRGYLTGRTAGSNSGRPGNEQRSRVDHVAITRRRAAMPPGRDDDTHTVGGDDPPAAARERKRGKEQAEYAHLQMYERRLTPSPGRNLSVFTELAPMIGGRLPRQHQDPALSPEA
jgi:hypothetical protein